MFSIVEVVYFGYVKEFSTYYVDEALLAFSLALSDESVGLLSRI